VNRTVVTNMSVPDNWTFVNESVTDMLNNTTPESFFGPMQIASAGFGGLFIPLLIMFTVGIVYVKTASFPATTFVLILLSSVAVPFVPAATQIFLYVMVFMGIAGLIYSAYYGGRQV